MKKSTWSDGGIQRDRAARKMAEQQSQTPPVAMNAATPASGVAAARRARSPSVKPASPSNRLISGTSWATAFWSRIDQESWGPTSTPTTMYSAPESVTTREA